MIVWLLFVFYLTFIWSHYSIHSGYSIHYLIHHLIHYSITCLDDDIFILRKNALFLRKVKYST